MSTDALLCCEMSSLLRPRTVQNDTMMLDNDLCECIDGDAGRSFRSREYKSILNIRVCFSVDESLPLCGGQYDQPITCYLGNGSTN